MQKISHIDIVPFWEIYKHILQTKIKKRVEPEKCKDCNQPEQQQ